MTDISANLPEGIEPAPAPRVLLPPVNTGLAIAAFITVWFVPLLGVILGHVDNADAKRNGRQKAGLAMAAVIIGYIGVILGLILAIIIISALAKAGQSAPDPYATIGY